MFFQLDNLCSGYGAIPIVSEVNLEVAKGEICIILGRNGVGKTTLLKTIIGSIPATCGRIVFAGQSVEKLDSHQRARLGMGYVPQGRGIFPELTVEENLRMGEGINAKNNVYPYDTIYGYFPILKKRGQQKGGTLSGGEQQMLALGRALISNPLILLLDEPSEGVQPSIVEEIGDVLAALNRDLGLTILLVEQNIEYALAIAKTCHIMTKGRIVDCLDHERLQDVDTVKQYLAI